MAILVAGILLLRWPPVAEQLTQDNVTALLSRLEDAWWAPLALLALLAAGSIFGMPVSPILVAGGAVFGALLGSVYNVLGLFLGAVSSFVFAHRLGREIVAHLFGQRLRRAERLFDKRGFWPLVQIRFLPVPFAVVNYGAALAGVRPGLFFLATGIGLLPATVMHTGFAAWLARAPADERARVVIAWGVVWTLLAIITGVPTLRQALRRRRRYRELMILRRGRG